MKFVLTVIVMGWLFLGCKPRNNPIPIKKPFVPVYKNCDSTLKVLWQRPVLKDTAIVFSSLYDVDDNLIYNIEPFKDLPLPELGFFTFKNLEIEFIAKFEEDKENKIYVFNNSRQKITVNNEILSYTDGRNLYGFSKNAQFLWKSSFNDEQGVGGGAPFLSSYKNFVYYPSLGYEVFASDYLFKVNINTGVKQQIFTEPRKDSLINFIDPPVGFELNGDEMLAFQIRKHSFAKYYNQADFMVYNVTKNKMLWRRDSLDRYGFGSANQPLYENNKIYYASSFDLNCLDVTTGKMLWRQSFENYPYELNFSNLLLTEEGLIVHSNAREMSLLDKNTGKIIWENRSIGSGPKQLTYYKGDLIFNNFGTGTLECVNVKSGLLKWSAKSPYNCQHSGAHYGINEFVIDPKTNQLYICDNFFYYCLKLPGYD